MDMRLWDNPRRCWRLMAAALPVWGMIALLGGWGVQSRPIPGAPTPEVHAPDRGQQADRGAGQPLTAYQAVWSRPLRQRLEQRQQEPEEPKPQERSLRWRLIGTAVEGPRSHALLQAQDGSLRVAAVGERLDTFRVHTIQPQQVGLWRDGALRYLRLPEALRRLVPKAAQQREAVAAASQNAPQDAGTTADADEADQDAERGPMTLSDLSARQFMDEVRLVPAMGDGTSRGFRIDSIASDGHVTSVGLRAGDLIAAVDGRALEGLSDLRRLTGSLNSGEAHQWRVVRSGASFTVHIEPARSPESSGASEPRAEELSKQNQEPDS